MYYINYLFTYVLIYVAHQQMSLGLGMDKPSVCQACVCPSAYFMIITDHKKGLNLQNIFLSKAVAKTNSY